MADSQRFLVMDACVLIDFLEVDRSIFGVVAENLAPIAIVRPVFDELEDLDEDEAGELGLEIVEVDLALAAQAASSVGALSFEDRLCLLLAAQEGWTCVTNDVPLRKACQQANVPVMWGLEMILELVRADGLGEVEAEGLARAIHAQNPHYITVKILDEFLRKLRGQ